MKLFTKIITLTLLTATLSHANITNTNAYMSMTTQELQSEVEKLSQEGNLPFEMGLELLERWKKA
jgi:hypothetical protein